MKTLEHKLIFIFLCGLLLAAASASEIAAQKRKPAVSKKAQIAKFKADGLKQFLAGQLDTAVETFSKCIALKPVLKDADECYFGRGASNFMLGKYVESIPDFDEAYRSFMDFNAVYMRGRANFELKKYKEANRDFRFVTMMVEPAGIKKDFPDIYGYSGATYMALDELDNSIEDYTKALELMPGTAVFYYARGVAYQIKADFPNAEKDLAEALRLDPKLKPQVDEVLERIKIQKNQFSM